MSPIDYTVEKDHDWWSQTGSNRRPPECKSGALPAELWPRKVVQPIVGSFERDGSEEHLKRSSKPILCDPERVHPISKLVSKIRSTYLTSEG